MAHKTCVEAREAYERTDEYKVEKARDRVQAATNRYNVAVAELETAYRELSELTGE